MGVKAELIIKLLANDVIVAESEDTALWNRVFSAIAAGATEIGTTGNQDISGTEAESGKPKSKGSSLSKFAEELGVDEAELIGACNPEEHAPFIHLDESYWEKLRKQTGSRGKNAVAPVTLAVTLLALWSKHRGVQTVPTAVDGKHVLDTIHLADKNPSRSLKNCEWLQQRGGGWIINPAKRSQAVRLATAYVTGAPPSGEK
ncbi:MAG: hypothetical protein ABIV48_00205 [Pyrinomonadaceae bacterium]